MTFYLNMLTMLMRDLILSNKKDGLIIMLYLHNRLKKMMVWLSQTLDLFTPIF